MDNLRPNSPTGQTKLEQKLRQALDFKVDEMKTNIEDLNFELHAMLNENDGKRKDTSSSESESDHSQASQQKPSRKNTGLKLKQVS